MGPAKIIGRHGEDYEAIYSNDPTAAIYSIGSGNRSVWLPSEKPGVVYDDEGYLLNEAGVRVADHVEYAAYVPQVQDIKHPLRYPNHTERHESCLVQCPLKGKTYDELLKEARQIKADVVDEMLPKHYHQTLRHSLRIN